MLSTLFLILVEFYYPVGLEPSPLRPREQRDIDYMYCRYNSGIYLRCALSAKRLPESLEVQELATFLKDRIAAIMSLLGIVERTGA